MTRDDATPGRPREGTAILTRLRDSQLAELDRMAAARGVSRAAVLRDVVEIGLTALRNPA